MGMHTIPDQVQLECPLREQLKHSNQFKQRMMWYDMTCPGRDYNTLWKMVQHFLDKKQVEDNRDAYSRRTHHPTPAAPGNPSPAQPAGPSSAGQCPKGSCIAYWRTGKCKNGGNCTFNHPNNPNRGRSQSPGTPKFAGWCSMSIPRYRSVAWHTPISRLAHPSQYSVAWSTCGVRFRRAP